MSDEAEMLDRPRSWVDRHRGAIETSVLIWRSVMASALIGIGLVMWQSVTTIQTLVRDGSQATKDIGELKAGIDLANSKLTSVQNTTATLQVTINEGLRQAMAEQARRIQALEERNQRMTDELTATVRTLAGHGVRLESIQRELDKNLRK